MVDRGFDILEDLAPRGVRLNIPSFLHGKTQPDQREITETRRIASLRVHIERCMERIKSYHTFDGVMPLSLMDVADQLSSSTSLCLACKFNDVLNKACFNHMSCDCEAACTRVLLYYTVLLKARLKVIDIMDMKIHDMRGK